MSNPAPGFKNHPNHKIVLDTGPDVVTVMLGDEMVAATSRAILLHEDRYPVRAYVPVADILATLTMTKKTTHCPFKGDTTYFDVAMGKQRADNGAWSYPAPFDEMAPIKDFVAFDDRFEVEIG